MQAITFFNHLSFRFSFRRARYCAWAWVLLLALPVLAQAHPAWGIVVAPEGTVYFSDTERNRIWMLTTNGRLRTIAVKQHTHGLYFGADGYLYGEAVEYEAKTQPSVPNRTRDAARVMLMACSSVAGVGP